MIEGEKAILNLNREDVSKGIIAIHAALKDYEYTFYRFKTINKDEAAELKEILSNAYKGFEVRVKNDDGEFVFFIEKYSV